MKKHTLLSYLITLSFLNIGYTQGAIEIIKEFKDDEVFDYEAWGVSVDEEGFIYWPVNIDSLNTGYDIVCFKYDSEGVEQWDKALKIKGQGAQQSYIINHHNNQLFIGGRTCSGLVNTCDMLLAKADPQTGQLTWEKSLNFPSDGYDEVDGLEIYNDTIYCGGWAQSLEPGIYNSDIGFWTLNQEGETLWTNDFGQKGSAEHQDGHFVVDEDYIYAAGLWNGTGIANLHNGYSFLGKFSRRDGSLVDSVLFGHKTNAFLDIENALGLISDGTDLFVTGYTSPGAVNDWQLYIAKFNKDLEMDWYTLWGAEEAESARALAVRGDLLFLGGVSGSPSLSNGGQDNVFLVIDKNEGTILEEYVWGGDADDSVRDVIATDNYVYMSGTSNDNFQGSSAFLARYEIISSTAETDLKPFSVKAYPNPFSNWIDIHASSDIIHYTIYDLTGQLILKEKLSQQLKRIQVNLQDFPTGTYLAHLTSSNQTQTIKLQKM